jgi:decaprenylphospho-beta-D-ribofuranose 2-oxidase
MRNQEFDLSSKLEKFSSFDMGVNFTCSNAQPDRYRHWDSLTSDFFQVSRGAGLSLSAASFGEKSVSVSLMRFNRVLDFDPDTGEIEVEAGIRLYSLFNFLASNGRYLPIQPGHGQISIGGCVAADVHGKNQLKDGTFIEQVISLKLFHPAHGLLELSRESNKELFFLTCGGYGLTGHILSVKLKTQTLTSQNVITKTRLFDDIDSGLSLLSEEAVGADFLHSWHDFTRPGSKKSSGVVFVSNFEQISNNEESVIDIREIDVRPLGTRRRMPASKYLVNRFSVRILNSAYKKVNSRHTQGKKLDLADALFPIHRLQTYYYILGNNGFHEYQMLLPKNIASNFLSELATIAETLGVPITLASGKLFGGQQDLLRFSGEGICFAINFPRSEQSGRLLKWLDHNLVICGGKPNLIKDSRLPRQVAEACYPGISEFRESLLQFDPKRLFRSEMSERLGL